MNAIGNSPLLRISSDAGTIEIRGPVGPPAGLMRGITAEDHGRLRISSHGVAEAVATYLDTDGEVHEWSASSAAGPLLFEEQTYHLWIDGHDHAPVVRHRDPLFVRDITHRPDHRAASGTFNLQRQVGVLPFTVDFGLGSVDIELEVMPTKIDYATDYDAVVEDVAGTARGLAFAYLRSTHRGASHVRERATEIEWLTVLRQNLAALQRAMHRVNEQPHRHLLREVRPTPNYKVRRLDAVVRRAITRGKGSGPIDEVAGLGPIRRTIDSVNAVATLDTPEHRWLNLQIRGLHRQIQAIAAVLDDESRRSPARVGERRRAERDELQRLGVALERLLSLDVLREAQQLPQPSPPSLTLLSAPGYREAYQILTELRLGLAVGGDALELQTKDIHDLYELWAFIEVVRLVAGHTETNIDVTSLIRHYSGGLRIDLSAGKVSDVTLGGTPRTFVVSYNRVYPGQTGDQKPDIVITVVEPNQPDLVVVLDAKYRVDATNDYRKRFGAPGPPIDAINALHRYRDAILTQLGPYRPVVRGAALFPLTVEETGDFETKSELYTSLSRLGIGALPFLPGNTTLAARWLGDLLALPIAGLAWNGPPGPIVGGRDVAARP